ncbi:hypothetical protein, partial [Mycobacteroides abscessus]|uniref:hypothetical protein n=1 Tax=Mycobacteroides abscessus TaxID=36809 RepID=UPI000A3FEC61
RDGGGTPPPPAPAPKPTPPAPAAKAKAKAKPAPKPSPTVHYNSAPTAPTFDSAVEELLHKLGPEAKFRPFNIDQLTERAEAEARSEGGEPAVEELRGQVERLRDELDERLAKRNIWRTYGQEN